MKKSLLILIAILNLSNFDMQSNKQTNYLIISNSNGHDLLKFDLTNGQYVGVFNVEANNQLNFPDGITINAEEICNGASIPAPYLGDMTLDQERSINGVIGSNTNPSIGGVVKLSAPEYHTLTCVIPPNSNLKSPMGISVVN